MYVISSSVRLRRSTMLVPCSIYGNTCSLRKSGMLSQVLYAMLVPCSIYGSTCSLRKSGVCWSYVPGWINNVTTRISGNIYSHSAHIF